MLPGRSRWRGSTSKAVCLEAAAKTASHKQGGGHRRGRLTCKLVQVNGKWNALSTCLLYLWENATHCHYTAMFRLHSQ